MEVLQVWNTRKEKDKNTPKTTDNPKMIIRTQILIITSNVNRLQAPTKRHRQAEWIQKWDLYIYIYAIHKRPTSDIGTHTDWKWGDGKRYYTQMEIKRKLE